jgi:hypothetical protein
MRADQRKVLIPTAEALSLAVRGARWSEAVAVGNLNFVEKMKSEKKGGAS